MKRHLAIALALLFALYCVLPGCVNGKLTQAGENALDTLELVLCEGFTSAFFPPGIMACPGSEALLKAGLDKVTEQADAGAGGASVKLVTRATHPLIRTKHGYAVFYGARNLGYAPKAIAVAFHTPEVQRYLDTVVAYDAGSEAMAFPPLPVPPQAALPLLDAGH